MHVYIKRCIYEGDAKCTHLIIVLRTLKNTAQRTNEKEVLVREEQYEIFYNKKTWGNLNLI